MKKQYKNVYTILEKVKKGELNTYYKDRDGLFGKIHFYKKPDLISPHLHYLDNTRLQSIVKQHVIDATNVKKCLADNHSAIAKKVGASAVPNQSDYQKKFEKNFENFPKHLVDDIFKMYYNKINKLTFEDRTSKNQTKFKILEKANNPVGKIMTENSNLKSAIFTRNMISYIISRMTVLEFTDKQEHKNMLKSMNGGSDFDQQSEEGLDKLFNNQQAKDQLEKAMQEAQDLCKSLDQVMDDDVQEKIFDSANTNNGKEAGLISPDYIRKAEQRLETISFSMNALKEKIKKLLDKSVNYFSSSKITFFEDLFNSDNIGDLNDYELLHPKIRNIFMEDIMIKQTKNVGKIDLYIDISGSMSSSCGVRNSKGDYISNLDFCKSFAFKLEQLGILNNLYVFNTTVKKYKKDAINIAMLDTCGGTTINAVLNNIDREGVNALVITDAEDYCSIYSDKAFFIGVEGADFSSFAPDTISEYSSKGQAVIFNGTRIINIDTHGVPIH